MPIFSAHMLHNLREAVTSRMVADVPLVAFLSGGVDSSSVVALMAEASRAPVKTCTIGFDVSALDETAYASRIAGQYGTEHSERTVGSEDFALVDRLAAMFDEPFADASALPTFRVCELAREHVTVALSGDGADEAFAGYRLLDLVITAKKVSRGYPRCAAPAGARRAGSALSQELDRAPRPLRAKTTLLSLRQRGGRGMRGRSRSLGLSCAARSIQANSSACEEIIAPSSRSSS